MIHACFALVIGKHSNFIVLARNDKGKWLVVKETKNRGWWVPGGRMENGETFMQAAIRETKEEARVDVELKGVLRVEHTPCGMYYRMRVIFYAEPTADSPPPKSEPDSESEEARWVSLDELLEMKVLPPGWRGDELYNWAKYIEDDGKIYPISILSFEGETV